MSKMISDASIRIGTVPYCNAWPLTHFLEKDFLESFPGANLAACTPSKMLFELLTHRLDIVLMPIIELMSLPSGLILGNACVSCNGPVQSVLLYSKCPLEDVKTIALDANSRSSVTLADVILRSFYGAKAKKFRLSHTATQAQINAYPTDAIVLIGDRALTFQPDEKWLFRHDLGQLWHTHTGLPFVFAAWITCSKLNRLGIKYAEALNAVRNKGVISIERIIEEKKGCMPLDESEMLHYLTKSVRFHIGNDEKDGINEFFDRAKALKLIAQRNTLQILDFQ